MIIPHPGKRPSMSVNDLDKYSNISLSLAQRGGGGVVYCSSNYTWKSSWESGGGESYLRPENFKVRIMELMKVIDLNTLLREKTYPSRF